MDLAGQLDKLGPATDIFALGATLWVFIGPAFLNWYLALSSGLRGS